jgi:hypothetical protein
MVLDIVFSLDSVITAVGMADDVSVMIAAVVIAVAIMMFLPTSLWRTTSSGVKVRITVRSGSRPHRPADCRSRQEEAELGSEQTRLEKTLKELSG